jgi:chromosome partitioning protein
MPAIITLAHQKGGVGKTTLTLNLYAYLNKHVRCAIVDADPQGSIIDLFEQLKEQEGWRDVELISRNAFKSFADLSRLEQYDILLIDTPPYMLNTLPEIFTASDFVLIPSKASPLDALAIQSTVELVKAAQTLNPHLKAAIVLNMTINNTDFSQQVRQILAQAGLPILNTEIGNRVAYSRSLLFAPSVFGEGNSKAAEEITALANEIVAYIQQN